VKEQAKIIKAQKQQITRLEARLDQEITKNTLKCLNAIPMCSESI